MRRRAVALMLAALMTAGLAVTGLTGCGSDADGVVYTTLTAFMGPWVDFIFAKVICRANSDQYTIAIGLWRMLEKEYIDSWYTCFAAGAVLISIPIAALFLYMQRYYVDGLSGAVKG